MFPDDTTNINDASMNGRDAPGVSGDPVRHSHVEDKSLTTIDKGVIITELTEPEADNLNGKFSKDLLVDKLDKLHLNNECDAADNLTKLPANLKNEFIDIVLAELDRLSTSARIKEVLFPSNLCMDELAFLASTASEYGCRLEFIHRGNVRYPKVIKDKQL